MAKTKTKKRKGNGRPKFELIPLPPDTYEKPTAWATVDGLRPAPRSCKVRSCSTLTDLDEFLCGEHRGQLNNRMKKGAARIVAKPERIHRRESANVA